MKANPTYSGTDLPADANSVCQRWRSTSTTSPVAFSASRESVINGLLLIYAAMTPLLVIPVAGLLGASDVLFFPTILAITLFGRASGDLRSQLLLLLFYIFVGFSLFRTEDPTYIFKWIRLAGILLPFFLASNATISLQRVIPVFFWSGLFAISLGIVLWWLNASLFEGENNQRIWLENGESRIRAAGHFGDSSAFGALVSMWATVCGCYYIAGKQNSKWMLTVVLAVSFVALLGSTSRASAAGIIAGVGAAMVFYFLSAINKCEFFLPRKTISIAALSLLLVAFLVWGVSPLLMGSEWLEVTFARFNPSHFEDSNSFLSGRIEIWKDYLSSIKSWGLLGVGYKQGHLHFASTPHNQLLSLAAENGIPCLLFFLFFLTNLIAIAIKNRDRLPFDSLVCLVAVSTFLADGLGGEPIGSWQVTPVTMLILGLCVSHFSSLGDRRFGLDCAVNKELTTSTTARKNSPTLLIKSASR